MIYAYSIWRPETGTTELPEDSAGKSWILSEIQWYLPRCLPHRPMDDTVGLGSFLALKMINSWNFGYTLYTPFSDWCLNHHVQNLLVTLVGFFFGVQITMITFFAAVIAMSFSHIWPFSPVIRFHWFHWSFPLMLHTTRKRNLALALNGFMNLGPLASSNQIWQAGKSSIEFANWKSATFNRQSYMKKLEGTTISWPNISSFS